MKPENANLLLLEAKDARIKELEEALERLKLPKEPPEGLLMSMALRWDHALGCPGYYDEMSFGSHVGTPHAERLKSTLSSMRQLYEEVSGHGFYSPDKEAYYSDMLGKSLGEIHS